MLNLILFGPPGAGKGTQSKKLIDKYSLIHLSTGDILRKEVHDQSELGKEAKQFMDNGDLVPDRIVIGMIESAIDRNKGAHGFIFDGFPRNTDQAKALDELLERKGTAITALIALEVEHEELVQRLKKRGEIEGRSDDQDRSVIENRIDVYNRETAPLIDYYASQSKHKNVSGMGGIDDIFERLCQTIDNLKET